MAWFNPTPREISALEQIETALEDSELDDPRRQQLLRRLWANLEEAHGSRILSVVSPEGNIIQSPFEMT